MKKSLLFALLLLPLFVFPQHTIKGFFSPAEDFNWAILYRTTAGTAMYAADTRSNAQGEFTLTLNGDIAPGHYYIVYGTPQEEKNFNLIYNGREDVALTYSVEKGVRFTASRENVLWQNYVEAMAQLNSEIGTLYKGKKHRKKAFKKLFEEKDKMQQTYEAASQGLLVQNFIKASRPYIPKKYKYEAAEVYAKNTRAAYFKNTPVTNEFLQNSRFISRRISKYVNTKDDLSTVAAYLKPASAAFKKDVYLSLWRESTAAGALHMAKYLSKNYLLPVATKLNDTELVAHIKKYESLLKGSTAPDFTWQNEGGPERRLSGISGAQNYVLVFWSSSCSHCLKEMPQLQKLMNAQRAGKYKVVAVGVEEDGYAWKNETTRYPKFEHVLTLGRWENEIVRMYDVAHTPTYFVLDANKTIVAKPDDFDGLIDYVEANK